MRINSRFFEAGQSVRLCVFEIQEGGEWSPPYGAEIVHAEPITSEGAIEGMYLWALIPDSKMEQVMREEDSDGS